MTPFLIIALVLLIINLMFLVLAIVHSLATGKDKVKFFVLVLLVSLKISCRYISTIYLFTFTRYLGTNRIPKKVIHKRSLFTTRRRFIDLNFTGRISKIFNTVDGV